MNPIAFELRKILVPVTDILPVRKINDPANTVRRYKTILASLKEVGLIEPLMVYPQKDSPGRYLLLDGHLRLFALKELGQTTADCVIANDDECFTYNARVSRVSPIQEHRMIVKAVEMGVAPERIAAALNVPVRVVQAYMNLLVGIHPEAADLLKTKNMTPRTLHMLRRVDGVRQVEIAELMIAANNYTTGYAEALILGTPKNQFNSGEKPRKRKTVSAEKLSLLQQEMETLQCDLKALENDYGQNVLNLTVARSYIRKLLGNPLVTKYLITKHDDIYPEFETIAATELL